MVYPDVKKITQITDPRIIEYVRGVVKFWEPIEFEGKFYYRTFQDNVYLKD